MSRLRVIRAVWFAGGMALGMAVMYLFSGSSDGQDASDTVALQEQAASSQGGTPTLSRDQDMPLGDVIKAAQAQPEVASKPAAPVWPRKVEVAVASGDTLIDILARQGVDHVAAHRIAKQVNKVYNLRKLRPGRGIEMVLAEDTTRQASSAEGTPLPAVLERMTMFVSKLETVHVTPSLTESGTYEVTVAKKEVKVHPVRGKGIISSSLYATADQQGVPDRVVAQAIKNFSYDIDFQRDIKAGDVIDLVYEAKKTEDGDVVGSGNLLYASLQSKGKTFRHYYFKNSAGFGAYFNEKGESIVKALLRTPVDAARISSGYGMRRHPILGYSKMHTGVDFAAPTGTPIYAAGDGVVSFAGRNGGYGNMVKVQHNGTYTTAYAHASRFARGIRTGVRVRQGQTIAYVGSTGRSTGPHLHYEIIKHGQRVNPLSVKVTGGETLSGTRLAEFKRYMNQMQVQLAQMDRERSVPKQESVALAQ